VSELTQKEKLTRKRLAAEEGAKALEEVAKKVVDVRANMARLRALRLAKEAQEVRTEICTSNQINKTKPKRLLNLSLRIAFDIARRMYAGGVASPSPAVLGFFVAASTQASPSPN